MFTGLVEELGTLARLTRKGPDAELEVRCGFRDYVLGESIAVNGVCLSVTRWGEGWFTVDASAETLAKTSLSEVGVGGRVHLERALAYGARVGGHLVTGHVDGVGRVVSREPLGEAVKMTFEVPPSLAPFLAPKGSVAVDGTSLTVNGASGTRFDVVLVPITQGKTLLVDKQPGAKVNLEVDVLAKYVARLLGRPGVDGVAPGHGSDGGVTLELLREQGYV
ncbi:MAG: riboflavin synthase [Sandaracinaceae bacterium]